MGNKPLKEQNENHKKKSQNKIEKDSPQYLEAFLEDSETLIKYKTPPYHYYLSGYPNIVACSCIRAFEPKGVRRRMLSSIKDKLNSYNKNETIKFSFAGSSWLYLPAQVATLCINNGYNRIQMDLFDLKYISKNNFFQAKKSFKDFFAFFKEQNIGFTISKKSDRLALKKLDLIEHIENEDQKTNSSVNIELRVFGDINSPNPLKYYKDEKQKRILISCDLLGPYYNPFPLLNAIRSNLAPGSTLLVANKHKVFNDPKITSNASTYFFALDKHIACWDIQQFNVIPINSKEPVDGLNKPFRYLQRTALTGVGPSEKEIDDNGKVGPFADWARF